MMEANPNVGIALILIVLFLGGARGGKTSRTSRTRSPARHSRRID